MRYEHFQAGKLDLGNMVQTVWNTGQGNFFLFTDPYSTETISRLATHADFFLILLTPLFLLFPTPYTLLILQVIVVGAGSIFIYLISEKLIKRRGISILFALLYLANPSVERTVLYDFHSVVLATTFLLGAWYFLLEKRYGWFVFFCLLAGSTKEQVWLITGFLGIWWGIKWKEYARGGVVGMISFFLLLFLILYAIPQANQAPHFALNFYSEYGTDSGSVTKNLIKNPEKVIGTIVTEERGWYLFRLFSPLSFLSFFSPLLLVFMGPELLGYLVSSQITMRQLYYQYTATLTPFLFLSSMYGVTFLLRRIPKKRHTLFLLGVFLPAFFFAHKYGPLPLSEEPQIDMLTSLSQEKKELNRYLLSLSPTDSVSASNNIGGHVAERANLFIFPQGDSIADVIVIDKKREGESNEALLSLKKSTLHTVVHENERFVIYRRVN